MNISTGGPHILLFERDQQLTALITSEFQLAGYECHAARTAVEVFDALARYPIRIVLVDLAQAAAARREFWVALDTQRRGRGIHVMTFHCSNIAGYGPREPDDRSQNTAADLDIDGMTGLMKLVDEVRNRVPSVSSAANTIPRLPRTAPTPTAPPATQRTGPLAPIQTGNTGSFRSIPVTENTTNSSAASRNQPSGAYSPPAASPSIAPAPSNRAGINATPPPTNTTASTKSASYTDKIRAVLYPNQRNWSTQGSSPAPSVQTPPEQPATNINSDTRQSFQSQTSNTAASGSTVLQRLANGQTSAEGQAESGLAQLSRLAQANYTAPLYETRRDNYQQSAPTAPIIEARFTQSSITREQTTANTEMIDGAPVELPEQVRENISAQPLRASPIQDIPIDRPGSNQTTIEGGRRPDVLSRTNYGQQQTPTTPAPLASISATAPPPQVVQASGTLSATQPVQRAAVTTPFEQTERRTEQVEKKSDSTNYQAETHETIEELDDSMLEDISSILADTSELKQQSRQEQGQALNETEEAQNQNTMLFDIMQSLPPMPPVSSQSQTVQAQVLNGRATRSLGSVLLAGHLVPQNRLEVAQNIQRMLRGVDLNYQLGEILLMFKLLTPDQLLAASLVSYGMITTAQVSALGRIRQELHSIGLEYDLESLLILFRILTPEQLREAKSGMQG